MSEWLGVFVLSLGFGVLYVVVRRQLLRLVGVPDLLSGRARAWMVVVVAAFVATAWQLGWGR